MISKKVTGPDGTVYLKFYCPGCKCFDMIPIEGNTKVKKWQFTGTEECPTLEPSIKQSFPEHDGIPERTVCHYRLINGVFTFYADCSHEFVSQQVPALNFE